MNFNDMKYAIYESYKNGEMSKDAATRLLESFESASIDRDLDIALEAADAAQSSFMESAMSYSNGYESQAVFEKKAESLSDKVKAAWEAFKKWIKQMIDKISSKISQIKAKITGKEDQNKKINLPFDLSKVEKFLSDCIDHIKPPYDFQGWWDKFMNMPVLDLAKAAGIATGSIITISQRNKIMDGIKDKLMKLSSKLTDLEAKNADTKGIHILRSIISMVNGLVIKAAYSIHTDSDTNSGINVRHAKDAVVAQADEMDEKYPEYAAARKALAEYSAQIKTQDEALCTMTRTIVSYKEKLDSLDVNSEEYARALDAYQSAMSSRNTVSANAEKSRLAIKDLNERLQKVSPDVICAQKAFLAEYQNYETAVFSDGMTAIRGAVMHANYLAHAARKCSGSHFEKTKSKAPAAANAAKARCSEARDYIKSMNDIIDSCMKTASGIKKEKKVTSKYVNMRKKVNDFVSQITSVENFLKQYKL